MKTNFDPQAQKAIQSARTVARQMKNTFKMCIRDSHGGDAKRYLYGSSDAL